MQVELVGCTRKLVEVCRECGRPFEDWDASPNEDIVIPRCTYCSKDSGFTGGQNQWRGDEGQVVLTKDSASLTLSVEEAKRLTRQLHNLPIWRQGI
jgi:hypothetical protein